MEIQTIQQIKEQVELVEEALREFIARQHSGQKYGKEQEYTPQSLKDGINALLVDLRRLAKAPRRFIQVSTYDERNTIDSYLSEIADSLNDGGYDDIVSHLELLKPLIRTYKLSLLPETQAILVERADQLHSKSEETTELQEESRQNHKIIEEALTAVKSHEELIGSFVQRVEKRQQQLDKQEQSTTSYQEQLKVFEQEHKAKLESAEKLINQARTALGYKTAVGISASFSNRYTEEQKKSKISLLWLAGAAIFIATGVVIGIWLFLGEQAIGLGAIILRITIMSTIFSGAWFCAAQYVRYKNTMDDYGYKSVLAKSIVAFLDQLTDSKEKEYYLQTVLYQIHQDPLRKKHDIDTPFKNIKGLWKNNKKASTASTNQ